LGFASLRVQVTDAGHITYSSNNIGGVTLGRPDEIAAIDVFSIKKRVVAFAVVSISKFSYSSDPI
jgi:hypothetical protein